MLCPVTLMSPFLYVAGIVGGTLPDAYGSMVTTKKERVSNHTFFDINYDSYFIICFFTAFFIKSNLLRIKLQNITLHMRYRQCLIYQKAVEGSTTTIGINLDDKVEAEAL